jgi:hypothetical protein
MAKVPPYHSISPEDPDVYHDHDDCYEGRKILSENKRPGTDDRRKCEVCARLG